MELIDVFSFFQVLNVYISLSFWVQALVKVVPHSIAKQICKSIQYYWVLISLIVLVSLITDLDVCKLHVTFMCIKL